MTAADPRVSQIRARLQIYQDIAQSEYSVPPHQALPIASRPDIAFRPSCYQLNPVWEPTATAWVWDGQILHRTPGESLATEEKLAELAAAGVCLVGSNIRKIPLVFTDEVFPVFQQAVSTAQEQIDAQPVATVNTQRWHNRWDVIIWAALQILALSFVIAVLRHRASS